MYFLAFAAMFTGRADEAIAASRELVRELPREVAQELAPYLETFLGVPYGWRARCSANGTASRPRMRWCQTCGSTACRRR